MEKISGIILTHNSQRTITNCLNSVIPCLDELIIIDDDSTDKTLDIVKQLFPEARIYHQKLDRFDKQRNYGISLAKNPWVLMIDSDESLSPELQTSIKETKEETNIDGYFALRMNDFFDTQLKEINPERPILFRSSVKFIRPVHEIAPLKDRAKKLPGHLNHHGWLGIEENMKKMNTYSTLIAGRWHEEKRIYNDFTLFLLSLLLPLRYFFICFFKKRFYRAGLFTGLLYSLFESSWWLAVIFKYREIISNYKIKK